MANVLKWCWWLTGAGINYWNLNIYDMGRGHMAVSSFVGCTYFTRLSQKTPAQGGNERWCLILQSTKTSDTCMEWMNDAPGCWRCWQMAETFVCDTLAKVIGGSPRMPRCQADGLIRHALLLVHEQVCCGSPQGCLGHASYTDNRGANYDAEMSWGTWSVGELVPLPGALTPI